MKRLWLLAGFLLLTAAARAAEKRFDLGNAALGQPPKGWRSLLVGEGKPGDWQVKVDDVPADFAPLTPGQSSLTKGRVITQLSKDPTDERFPLLVYEDEIFTDFTFTLRFKIVSGVIDQMAGVAFRLKDEKNFFVFRASALGQNIRFYKVENGLRSNPIGPEIPLRRDVWQELTVDCRGNRIRLSLEGKLVIPELTDSTFTEGKLALWTKSDSVACFTDLKVTYTPRVSLAQELVNAAMRRYPRVRNLRIYAATSSRPELHVVAGNREPDLGQAGTEATRQCLEGGIFMAGKVDGNYVVTLPLRDRNGDPVGVVRVEMDSFPGQTDDNALARANPILRMMEGRVRSLKELTD